jgi:hypothetical protein
VHEQKAEAILNYCKEHLIDPEFVDDERPDELRRSASNPLLAGLQIAFGNGLIRA